MRRVACAQPPKVARRCDCMTTSHPLHKIEQFGNRKREAHWSFDPAKRNHVPMKRNESRGTHLSQFTPKVAQPCSPVAMKQGNRVAEAKFSTKMVYRPVKSVDANGQPRVRFIRCGIKRMVSVSTYGNTFIFAKMEKSASIRDGRDGKSKDIKTILKELTRLLGSERANVGIELLTKISG